MKYFIHDCSKCIYLDSEIIKDIKFDFYYCEQCCFPTVIARFGEGPSYISGLHAAKHMEKSDPEDPLARALQLAKEKGFIQDC